MEIFQGLLCHKQLGGIDSNLAVIKLMKTIIQSNKKARKELQLPYTMSLDDINGHDFPI